MELDDRCLQDVPAEESVLIEELSAGFAPRVLAPAASLPVHNRQRELVDVVVPEMEIVMMYQLWEIQLQLLVSMKKNLCFLIFLKMMVLLLLLFVHY